MKPIWVILTLGHLAVISPLLVLFTVSPVSADTIATNQPPNLTANLNERIVGLKTFLEVSNDASQYQTINDTITQYRTVFRDLAQGLDCEFDTLAVRLGSVPALASKLERLTAVRQEVQLRFQELDERLSAIETLCQNAQPSAVQIKAKLTELMQYLNEHTILERPTLIGSGELPHRLFSPERLWGGEVGSIGFWSPKLPASTSYMTPGSGDLLATAEVTITDRIANLASELDNNPLRIYQYVKNSIEYEPYFGSMKSADEVLRQRSGNDIDIAHLMIALLRASNIPARYTYGTVEIPIGKVKNWIGIEDEATLIRFLANNGTPTTAVYGGNGLRAVRIEHMWVDAYVNYGPYGGAVPGVGEKRWVPLDASFRSYTETPSIDISGAVPFDGMAYIESDTDLPPFLYYMDKVKEYLWTNYSETTELGEVFWNRNQNQEYLEVLPIETPYTVIDCRGRYRELPDILRHKVKFNVEVSGSVASKELAVYELQGKRLTLSYAPATAVDKAVMDEYNGYYNPPAFLIKLKPQIQIEGEQVITGNEIGLGEAHPFHIDFIFPGGMVMDRVSNDMVAGEYYGIAVVAGRPPNNTVAERFISFCEDVPLEKGSGYDNPERYAGSIINPYYYITDLLENEHNPSERITGELLFQTAMEYFNKLHNAELILSSVLRIRRTTQPKISITTLSTNVSYSFDIPSECKISGGFIDVDRNIYVLGDKIGNRTNEALFMQIIGYNNSYWEHEILQNHYPVEAISTITIFRAAKSQYIPILTISNDNVMELLPSVDIPTSLKSTIIEYINDGRTILIPRDQPIIALKKRIGFIAYHPSTGSGGYYISDQLAGSGTIFPVNGMYKSGASMVSYYLNGSSDITTLSLKVLMAFEEVGQKLCQIGYRTTIFTEVDTVRAMLYAIHFSRFEGLFYYQGHGALSTPALGFYRESSSVVKFVTPSDIYSFLLNYRFDEIKPDGTTQTHYGKGPRIVILFGCMTSSMEPGFMIDGNEWAFPPYNETYEMFVGYNGLSINWANIFLVNDVFFSKAVENQNASISGAIPEYPTIEWIVNNISTLIADYNYSQWFLLWRVIPGNLVYSSSGTIKPY